MSLEFPANPLTCFAAFLPENSLTLESIEPHSNRHDFKVDKSKTQSRKRLRVN